MLDHGADDRIDCGHGALWPVRGLDARHEVAERMPQSTASPSCSAAMSVSSGLVMQRGASRRWSPTRRVQDPPPVHGEEPAALPACGKGRRVPEIAMENAGQGPPDRLAGFRLSVAPMRGCTDTGVPASVDNLPSFRAVLSAVSKPLIAWNDHLHLHPRLRVLDRGGSEGPR